MRLGTSNYTGSRFGATIEQIKQDLGEGLKGKDWFGDVLLRAPRNILTATWHAIQGIIPSIANAFSDQKFSVRQRTGLLDGTMNSIKKIVHTESPIGTVSAIFAESPDGLIDDALSIFGASQAIVVPETRTKVQSLLQGA